MEVTGAAIITARYSIDKKVSFLALWGALNLLTLIG